MSSRILKFHKTTKKIKLLLGRQILPTIKTLKKVRTKPEGDYLQARKRGIIRNHP